MLERKVNKMDGLDTLENRISNENLHKIYPTKGQLCKRWLTMQDEVYSRRKGGEKHD